MPDSYSLLISIIFSINLNKSSNFNFINSSFPYLMQLKINTYRFSKVSNKRPPSSSFSSPATKTNTDSKTLHIFSETFSW